MASKIEKLKTLINTNFYPWDVSQKLLKENTTFKKSIDEQEKTKELNDLLKKISEKCLNSASFKKNDRYFHIAFSDYMDFKRTEENNLIYKIDNINGEYFISTGLYCGIINFGEKLPQLTIETGYSDLFFKRILNFCCGVYADNNTSNQSSENESIYSLLIQYLFLVSLRKVVNKAIPKKYQYPKLRDYNINGNIDIESYINYDLLAFDKKVTYIAPKRTEIQNIIDVLHCALASCKIKRNLGMLPNMINFENYINQLYSGIKPSKKIILNICKDKALLNSLYADYKKPLELAKILLSNHDLNSGNSKNINGISGFLVDASFLWEMYLYNLMKIHLKNWKIDAQYELSFYDDTFYRKKNYPDFVLTNISTRHIFVLDAKFKRMKYDNVDVDNNDLRQLHAYSYYFHLKYGDNFKGAGLIYPTKEKQPDDKKFDDKIYGIGSIDKKFEVFTIKDPSPNETIFENEKIFINNLKRFLND